MKRSLTIWHSEVKFPRHVKHNTDDYDIGQRNDRNDDSRNSWTTDWIWVMTYDGNNILTVPDSWRHHMSPTEAKCLSFESTDKFDVLWLHCLRVQRTKRENYRYSIQCLRWRKETAWAITFYRKHNPRKQKKRTKRTCNCSMILIEGCRVNPSWFGNGLREMNL